ncbi:hypothetical protein LTR37_002793 [Vermiconidia calcicola]|uniref:Uncharacterized protein n=1 Tax=Vermiconidia calcicola TaxID=1690605 RepID=A0ACC3NRQ4_9PEZI|nr:hypothetical protein LTR37_002793 [Vermiconidia calcicola]
MADALIAYFRQSLPAELATLTEPYIAELERGEYECLLTGEDAKALFGLDDDLDAKRIESQEFSSWNDFVFHRLGALLADRSRPEKQGVFFCVGYAALLAFLQSNVTGPPLTFDPAQLLFPREIAGSGERTQAVRTVLLNSLSMDGIAAYRLTPNIELLCLADAIFTCPPILKHVTVARWAKLRLAFVHQRLLSELSSTLQQVIYDDLELLNDTLIGLHGVHQTTPGAHAEFLLERATVHLHHGHDKHARVDLDKAKEERGFEFVLTGLLGKRTKFQQTDISQLVVLAKSSDDGARQAGQHKEESSDSTNAINHDEAKPAKLDLNDDTLLESISFASSSQDIMQLTNGNTLPARLSSLDPANQPQLDALDSTILLTFASSVTNTSPQDGLTREETLPYATRVLEGGSSNWQVYTQALLVRSRIECHKSRTIERGLLQLQALVDQVIAETSGSSGTEGQSGDQSSSFLPRAKASESASVTERLRYIFQLASPSRWALEAELAARWVQLGGLRSALDIYERLEMWAEAALCLAATEREDKARKIVRRQLYHATDGTADEEIDEDEIWSGPLRDPPPPDAPRLYCILGDLGDSPEMYEKAWEVSNQRYTRAQRSLGRHYLASKDFLKAADAYSKSLRTNQLNHGSWFALGCALLELAQFEKAVETFSRCVQLDESDAEGWSNLAAALLRKGPENQYHQASDRVANDEEDVGDPTLKDAQREMQRNKQDALKALKRAATLKHESYRIWENLLIVSASVSPPDYDSILAAQKRIVDMRGATDGEKCIDFEILDLLVQHVISSRDVYDPEQPGLSRMAVRFIEQSVIPLITGSSDLWRLVSKLALWRNSPSSALDAEEKAWRAITSQPGWEAENEHKWDEVVEATVRLCDSYESLGGRERTEGLGAGAPVAKDWKFKARSAIRGILGRGKGSWEGTKGWNRLKEVMEDLRG